MRGFSFASARIEGTGDAITAPGATRVLMSYWNSAVVNGTSGGNSAIVDLLVRQHSVAPWIIHSTLTAAHLASGYVTAEGLEGYFAGRIVTAYNVNGSAPSINMFIAGMKG